MQGRDLSHKVLLLYGQLQLYDLNKLKQLDVTL